MTIYGKGCISNYRNCSLSYVWYSVLYRMLTDKKYVEYVIQDYDKPLGVATYKTSDEMPEKLKQALPDIEELKKLL